ncbi:MAG TPA: T9SS type A sorting domain-containing protein [Ignavibacteria bacterium]|nr:T9SS type A sorting domain-containing protein [Ignavibacteria bacterium]
MKKIIFLLLFSFSYLNLFADNSDSPKTIRPSDLGLTVFKGNLDENRMTQKQKDTIVIGLFNYQDYFKDIAVYYKSKNELIIYNNNGNGTLSEYKNYKQSKEIKKITLVKKTNSELMNSFMSRFDDLEIEFSTGEKEVLHNYRINILNENASKVPLRNFLDDGRVFLYSSSITFNEMWASWRSGQPNNGQSIGDIDNDGKTEAIYTFYPISDTLSYPLYKPTRVVVFENITPETYRIDWDTVLQHGGWNHTESLFDFDSNGKKEFLCVGPRIFTGELAEGVYECLGPGVYKFFDASFNRARPMFDFMQKDSVNINGDIKQEFWISYMPEENSTYIIRERFKTKYATEYFFDTQVPINARSFIYSICPGDIDNDGKDEVVIGDTQWESGYVNYLDSTGNTPSQWHGYSIKEIITNAPVSCGYAFLKDYDNDGKKEITTTGIGDSSGSLGVIKHTGTPGENNFQTVFYTLQGIRAGPNMGIDTASIEGNFIVLYPCIAYSEGGIGNQLTSIYKKQSFYDFSSIYFKRIDSTSFVRPALHYMDNDNKINIMTPLGKVISSTPTGDFFYTNFKQFGTVNITNYNNPVPENFKLYQNYPNPFNPITKIKFDIKKKAEVKLIIYDITGRVVEKLLEGIKNPGEYEFAFDGSNFSSGIYFYSLIIEGKKIDTKKMILIK